MGLKLVCYDPRKLLTYFIYVCLGILWLGGYSSSCAHVTIDYLTRGCNVATSALKTGLTSEYFLL